MNEDFRERFIASENVKRFNERLDECADDQQRHTLEQLLALEQAHLKAIDQGTSSGTEGNRGLPADDWKICQRSWDPHEDFIPVGP